MTGHERYLYRIAFVATTLMSVLVCIQTMGDQPIFAAGAGGLIIWSLFELIRQEAGETDE